MNDSARAGLEQLGARGEARGADTVLGAARSAVRRRRDRTRAAVALGVLVIVGVVAALVATRDGGDGGREIVTQPGEDDGAPPSDGGPLTIFLSDTVVPTSGAEVIAIVRNTGVEDWNGGFGVFIDRWDGADWQRVGQYPEPQVGGSTDIGLRAPAGGAASPERVQIPALEPGWYRLRKGAPSRDVKPTGVFEVRGGDVRTIDLPMGQHGLSIEPSLLERTDAGLASGQLTLTFGWYHPSPPGYGESVTAMLSPDARLDRWDGASWVQVVTLALSPDDAQPGRATADVPSDLASGAYRLTRTVGSGPDANGYFFVVDGTATTADEVAAPPPDEGPVTLLLSDTVLPVAGADVVVIVRNDRDVPLVYPSASALERWDGASWSHVRSVSTRPIGVSRDVNLTDIGVAARDSGVAEWIHLADLPVGWYRLHRTGSQGESATGTFRVIDADVPTVDLGDLAAGERLSVAPAAVLPGRFCQGECTLRIRTVAREASVDLAAFESTLDDGARLDRWTGESWRTVGEVDFSIEQRYDVTRSAGERVAALPSDLEPGAYRVVRTAPDGTELVGHFFVAR